MIAKRVAPALLAVLILLGMTACRSSYPGVPDPSGGATGGSYSTTIYVPKPDGVLSASATELKGAANRPKAAVEAMLKVDNADFFPKGVKVLDVAVGPKGTAVINFSRQILDKKVETQRVEALGLGAIVRTLAEFTNIKRVSIRVEGRSNGTLAGKDIAQWWGFGSIKLQPFAVKSGK